MMSDAGRSSASRSGSLASRYDRPVTVYLDHAATTPLRREVLERCCRSVR